LSFAAEVIIKAGSEGKEIFIGPCTSTSPPIFGLAIRALLIILSTALAVSTAYLRPPLAVFGVGL